MTRTSALGRFGRQPLGKKIAPRPDYFRARLELLEDRQLLSANDLLISTYDDTLGKSVLRYNEITHTSVAGGAATGDHGLGTVQGLAVAPDGSYYVSSNASFPGSVLHFSSSGTFLDVLGGSDANPVTNTDPFFVPGVLAFGPNGNLYVGDLAAGAIYQFDTTSMTQQFLAGDSLFLDYAPGGFTFAPDSSHDLIVGGIETQSVIEYHSDNTSTTFIPAASGINPAAIVAEANGDLLIADLALSMHATDHHQIVLYTAASMTTSQFANLTTPVGTGDSAGDAPQPEALLFDHDGNLLVGLSPDHNLNGAVEKFDINTHALMGTPISNIGTPTGLAFIPSIASVVADRKLFYAGSTRFDTTGNPQTPLPFSDDNAIATDKSAYLPGSGATTFANVSSYTLGINGLMVDVAGAHGTLSASDFTFKTGNNNSPSSWTTVAAAATVTTRADAGTGGSDRVEITFPDNAIQKTWLEVIFKGNDTLGGSDTNTGLAASDVFFWANALADDGTTPDDASAYRTATTDELDARNNPKTLIANIPITNAQDYNRDGLVSVIDQLAARNNPTTNISGPHILNIAGGGPFAPDAGQSASPQAATTAVSPSASLLAAAFSLSSQSASSGAAAAPRLSNAGTASSAVDKLFGSAADAFDPSAANLAIALRNLAESGGGPLVPKSGAGDDAADSADQVI